MRHSLSEVRQTPSASRRRGLAPLELVLALPLMLCVMALIVNFAHAATWKIRSAGNARLAMWRHRPMWAADTDPNPVNYWPTGASLLTSGTSRIERIDPIWHQSDIGQGWIRGPIFMAGTGYLAVRDNRVNEMAEGVSQGRAIVSLRYPFLPAMGMMTMRGSHVLVDSVWQYYTMGYGWNDARRAKGWWNIEDAPEWALAKGSFLEADQEMRDNAQKDALTPLDRDEELMEFYGPRTARSDFYPTIRFCLNDVGLVRELITQPSGLKDRILGAKNPRTPGVSERMANAYLSMYRTKLDLGLKGQLPEAGHIVEYQTWIKQLTDYLAQL